MKPSPSSLVHAAATAALLTATLTVRAAIIAPYQPDAATLHLWHFDEPGVPATDAVTGANNLPMSVVANGATLGNISFTGFGSALSTVDGGQNGIAATDKDAYAARYALVNAAGDNTAWSFAEPVTGAFTMEAIVRIDFDPTANLGATTVGGNGRNTPLMIIGGEQDGTGGGVRSWQFRLDPIGFNPGAVPYTTPLTQPVLEFINVNNGSGVQWLFATIPLSGPDAIVQGSWYHVAVTYDGNAATPDNFKVFWTLLDPSRTTANQILSAAMNLDLNASGAVDFAIGNGGRNPPNANFIGLIDEVRMSSVARSAGEMAFASSDVIIVTQPTNQLAAIGQPASFTVIASGNPPLFYQWRFESTPIPDATNSTLSFAAVQTTNAGSYDVVVTNLTSGATSVVATLTVRLPLELVWEGTWNTNWDLTQPNWLGLPALSSEIFNSGDHVIFNDIYSQYYPIINLVGALNPSSITVTGATSFTFGTISNGSLSGVAPLFKGGSGTLTVAANNTGSGSTTVEGGALVVGNGAASGSLSTGPITNEALIFFNRADTINLNSPLAGTGQWIKTNSNDLRLNATNFISGDLLIADGTLTLATSGALGTTTNIVVKTIRGGAGASGTRLALANGTIVASNVVATLPSSNSDGVSTVDWRSTLHGDSGTNVWNGPLLVVGNNTINFAQNAGAQLDVNGPVIGPDYTGRVTLRGGGLGIVRGTIAMPNGILAKTDGATWIVSSSGSTYRFTDLAGGTLALGNHDGLATNSPLVIAGATLDLAGFNQLVTGLTNTIGSAIIGSSSTNADSTFTLAGSDNWTFGGRIADVLGTGTRKVHFTLTGGSLTLTNVNTYSGETRVHAGTLILAGSGSISNTSLIRLAAGSTLDAVALASTELVLGSTQTLQATGAVTVLGKLTSRGVIAMNISKAGAVLNHSSITGPSVINYGGTLALTLSGDPLSVSDTLPLFSASSHGGAFDTITPATPGPGLVWDTSTLDFDGTLRIQTGATPQPGFSMISISGNEIVIQGTNGVAGQSFVVLGSTNVAAPLNTWLPVLTNTFGPGGVFSVTNTIHPATPQQFLLLRQP